MKRSTTSRLRSWLAIKVGLWSTATQIEVNGTSPSLLRSCLGNRAHCLFICVELHCPVRLDPKHSAKMSMIYGMSLMNKNGLLYRLVATTDNDMPPSTVVALLAAGGSMLETLLL